MRVITFAGSKFRFEVREEAEASVLNEIFKFREYRVAEPIIKTAKVIIDAGAHVGFFAHYCRALNPSARIICLEPAPSNLDQLNKHIKLNRLEGVTVLPLALSNRTGTADFYLTADNHNHSLIAVSDRKIRVKTIGLNDLASDLKIKRIDLLKMDLEGGEDSVLTDGKNWPKVGPIIFEYHGKTRVWAQTLRAEGFSVQEFPSRFDKNFGIIYARKK